MMSNCIGMMSACCNPVLYGILNENFKSEFKWLLNWITSHSCCSKQQDIRETCRSTPAGTPGVPGIPGTPGRPTNNSSIIKRTVEGKTETNSSNMKNCIEH